MLSMMETDAAFILDVYTEIFVWYGDGAERAARRGAGKVAHQLLRAVPRPRWAEDITHVRQAREPFLFRVKFFDWGVAGRRGVGVTGRAAEPVNCLTSFHKAVRTIAEVKHDPDAEVEKRLTDTLRGGQSEDLPFPVDAMVEAAGAGADEGYGQLLMWRVHPRGLVTVPEEEFGHMQSSHRYGSRTVQTVWCGVVCIFKRTFSFSFFLDLFFARYRTLGRDVLGEVFQWVFPSTFFLCFRVYDTEYSALLRDR